MSVVLFLAVILVWAGSNNSSRPTCRVHSANVSSWRTEVEFLRDIDSDSRSKSGTPRTSLWSEQHRQKMRCASKMATAELQQLPIWYMYPHTQPCMASFCVACGELGACRRQNCVGPRDKLHGTKSRNGVAQRHTCSSEGPLGRRFVKFFLVLRADLTAHIHATRFVNMSLLVVFRVSSRHVRSRHHQFPQSARREQQ